MTGMKVRRVVVREHLLAPLDIESVVLHKPEEYEQVDSKHEEGDLRDTMQSGLRKR